ncbi:alpha/beta fold hydrolase [Niabella aurantiaca]|uniref:alpha/beta fold hydrolase n=1 Tax=Niabella aurantiaca TaxID=379900 RepID=UPI0003A3403C|nr:alpha/beta hydrolase [Niabella aurantiaca]
MKIKNGYVDVNGIKMYYEIYGQGVPLVLIHGGGSTIQTSFGRIIPLLAQHRQLICVELQAHGRTSDRNAPLSFEQDADDVAALLTILRVPQADLFGFSNGGNTALQIAIRHPRLCRRIIAGSVLLKRNGAPPQFWEFMKKGTFEQMPLQYKEAFLRVTPDSAKLHNLFRKCKDRVLRLTDFSDEAIRSIRAPVLLINGNADVATPEHVVALSKLIPRCSLAILPGGHGAYIGEITTLPAEQASYASTVLLMEQFLDKE